MVRYFFHLNQCGSVTADLEGLDLPDLSAGRETAITAARDVMCGELVNGALCLGCHIDIADAKGRVLLTVRFIDAVHVTGL